MKRAILAVSGQRSRWLTCPSHSDQRHHGSETGTTTAGDPASADRLTWADLPGTSQGSARGGGELAARKSALASAAADFVCSGDCSPSRGCRAGGPVPCPRLRWPGRVPRSAARAPPASPAAAPGRSAFPGRRQRCSIGAAGAAAMFHRCRMQPVASARAGPRKRGTGRAGHEIRNCGRGKPSLPQH